MLCPRRSFWILGMAAWILSAALRRTRVLYTEREARSCVTTDRV